VTRVTLPTARSTRSWAGKHDASRRQIHVPRWPPLWWPAPCGSSPLASVPVRGLFIPPPYQPHPAQERGYPACRRRSGRTSTLRPGGPERMLRDYGLASMGAACVHTQGGHQLNDIQAARRARGPGHDVQVRLTLCTTTFLAWPPPWDSHDFSQEPLEHVRETVLRSGVAVSASTYLKLMDLSAVQKTRGQVVRLIVASPKPAEAVQRYPRETMPADYPPR
jgi:hypothetical protein